MLKEFKEFITKGNILDLAVGVVIGGAFQTIVNSLVNDIIMPLVSTITGNVDFSDRVWTLGDVSIKYGNFITAIVDFLIIAFCIFLFINYLSKLQKRMDELKLEEKFGNRLTQKFEKLDKKGKFKKKEEAPQEPTVKICPYCLSEIPYKATRCAHCTSELEKIENK